jgi:hypothetical protein
MARNSTGRRFLYVTRRVLLSPLSGGIWIAAIAASAAFHWSWIPIAVAVVLEALILNRRLNDEEYLRRILRDKEEGDQSLSDSEIEDRLGAMDFETRQRLRYVIQLQKEIVSEARAEDVQPYAREELERISARLPALVQQAIHLAARKQQLVRYLHHVDEKALQAYADNLRKRIAATEDPVARKQYEQALRAREAELATYRAIAQAAGRIDSQLENVEATFANWKAKVIRLKTVDTGSVASFSEGLVQELDTLGSEIETLDAAVSEALAPDVTVGHSVSGGQS